jgi:hypothetical protein
MTPVGAVIAGQNTSTASALELELSVKTGVSTTHKSSVAVRALSQDDLKSRYQPRPRHARHQPLPVEPLPYHQFNQNSTIAQVSVIKSSPHPKRECGDRSLPLGEPIPNQVQFLALVFFG